MLQSGFHGWQHREVQRSGDQEPAHARMRKDSSSVVKNQRSVISSSDSSSRGNKGGGLTADSTHTGNVAGVGGVSGWMGRTHVEC